MTTPPREQTRARYPDEYGYAEHDGVRVHYEAYGKGEPTILFLPTWEIAHSLEVPDFLFRPPWPGGDVRSARQRAFVVNDHVPVRQLHRPVAQQMSLLVGELPERVAAKSSRGLV